jgi:hypothetical protein
VERDEFLASVMEGFLPAAKQNDVRNPRDIPDFIAKWSKPARIVNAGASTFDTVVGERIERMRGSPPTHYPAPYTG